MIQGVYVTDGKPEQDMGQQEYQLHHQAETFQVTSDVHTRVWLRELDTDNRAWEESTSIRN